MNNQTQTVRNAINILIIVAVSISLFQQLNNLNHKNTTPPGPTTPGPTTPNGEPAPQQPTGPKLEGIRIQSSDNFQAPLKQLLTNNKLNIEITQYEFQGNQYWINMIANWGHMAIIFYFMTKHKSETDEGKKKQLMIVGAIAVVAWFYFSPKLKPQRFAIEVHGRKVYEKDYLMDQQVIGVLNEYEFQIDDLNQKDTASSISSTEKVDAWQQKNQQPNPTATQQPIIEDQIEF